MSEIACALADLQSDRVRRSLARFEGQLGLAERENEQLARLLALGGLALARQRLGDFAQVSLTTQELRRAGEAKGKSWMLSYSDYFDAVAALGNGDPVSAAHLGRAALRTLLGLSNRLWHGQGRPQMGARPRCFVGAAPANGGYGTPSASRPSRRRSPSARGP